MIHLGAMVVTTCRHMTCHLRPREALWVAAAGHWGLFSLVSDGLTVLFVSLVQSLSSIEAAPFGWLTTPQVSPKALIWMPCCSALLPADCGAGRTDGL